MTDLAALYDARVADGLIDDPAQRAVLPHLQRILDGLSARRDRGLLGRLTRAPEPVKGLYLWGGVGAGKSMLMDLLHDAAPEEGKRRVHFHAFMQQVHARLHEVRKTGVDDAVRPVADEMARGLRLLCFDEMQITDIADAMIVGRLFERLFAAGVTIVTTSNRPPEDLYKDGLNRALFLPFIDLLRRQMEIVHIGEEVDHRQGRLGGRQVYFHPVTREAEAAVEALWTDLAGGPGAPMELEVAGRRVRLPEVRNGVARASFWDLCGQPLGPADYLAIAAAVRVLILEGIPRLGRSNFNEARRFVILIDALYEARVVLIATAADAPESLYVEGEGSFEFARTASRLREMQASDWSGI